VTAHHLMYVTLHRLTIIWSLHRSTFVHLATKSTIFLKFVEINRSMSCVSSKRGTTRMLSAFVVCVPMGSRSPIDHAHGLLHGESSSLSTNHGGVTVVAVPGVHLSSFDVVSKPTSFELLCTRITSRKSTCIVGVIYRPGLASVSYAFFDD